MSSSTPSSTKKSPQKKKVYYLDCPFVEKDEVKALGAQWNFPQRKWYVPPSKYPSIGQFNRWFPFVAYLDCPFEDKDEAKQAGAKWDGVVKKWYYKYKDDKERKLKTVPPALHKWLADSKKLKVVKEEDTSEEPQKSEQQAIKKNNNTLTTPQKNNNKTTTSTPQPKKVASSNKSPQTPANINATTPKKQRKDPPATPPVTSPATDKKKRTPASAAATTAVSGIGGKKTTLPTPPNNKKATKQTLITTTMVTSPNQSATKKRKDPPETPKQALTAGVAAKNNTITGQRAVTDSSKQPSTPATDSIASPATEAKKADGDPRIHEQLGMQQLQKECEFRGIENYKGKPKEWLLKQLVVGTLWLSAPTTPPATPKTKKLKISDNPSHTTASLQVAGNGKLLTIDFSGLPRISSSLTISQLTHELVHRRRFMSPNIGDETPNKAGAGLSGKTKAWFLETLGVGSVWITGAALLGEKDDNNTNQQAEVLNQWPRISSTGITKSQLQHEIMTRALYSSHILSKGLSNKSKADLLQILGIGSIWETASSAGNH